MSLSPSRDDFAALLDESLGGRDFMEGTVVKGQVVGVEKDFAIIDVGLKTEGRVLMKEFTQDDGTLTLKVGDTVEVDQPIVEISTDTQDQGPTSSLMIRESLSTAFILTQQVV